MIGKRAGGRAELIARYHQHICRAASKVAQTGAVARPARGAGYSRLERNIMERDSADQRVLVKFIASVIDSMGHER
jgi:hypothetical protein